MVSGSSQAIEHGTTRPGRWLAAHRFRLAVWIAAAEALVVLFSHDLTKWTVIALAVVGAIAYVAGRESGSGVVRHVLWIFAASQLLAGIPGVPRWVRKWGVIPAVGSFAAFRPPYFFTQPPYTPPPQSL